MRFLECEHDYYQGYFRRRKYRHLIRLIKRCAIILAIAYILACLFIYIRQDYLIYQENQHISEYVPENEDFQLDYQNVWLNVPDSPARLHGWWFDAPSMASPVVALPDEPINILTVPKTILYLAGRGGSKTHYNNLARIKAFQQLGFSVLAIDYRGYGLSEGNLPNESRLYEDSQAAWNYLINEQQILPQDIFIYGESLGGAIAIDLALKQPEAAGLIVQSSFTTMTEQIKQFRPSLKIFPLRLILNQHFNSLEKVSSLAMPVLFLHGTADTIVDYKMSRQLYYAAPEPKALFYIPGGEHLRLYQPGENSYLVAIQKFIQQQN